MRALSNTERREIAEEIRSKTLYTRGSLGDWWMRLHEAVTDEEDFPCPAETMAAIADLIDRPTCRNVSGHRDVFECSECHCKVEMIAKVCNEYGEPFRVPLMPSFCPNCGAEVTDD